MWSFRARRRYEVVATDEDEVKGLGSQRPTVAGWAGHKSRRMLALLLGAAILIPLLSATAYYAYETLKDPALGTDDAVTEDSATGQPSTVPSRCEPRREWRTLSSNEQQSYISAVLCLRSQPSVLVPNSNRTSYDDFPWIHSHVGYYTHNSAPFLPWHRYFLHIYETTLRDTCGYQDKLVYWDWTLDSDALELSPVFDPTNGFGGDGEDGGEISVGRTGRCLVDGPFAGITADYYDVKYRPHCVSRGFRDLEGKLGHIDGHDIGPESIEQVLSLGDYESFVKLMESRVHDAIPFGIGGDFETFTAPYDPLFFLHHTQLDRLWWLWQQRQTGQGLTSYGGHKHRHSTEMSSLDDEINMQGLAPKVKVTDVMDVEGGLLCYIYA